MESQVIRDALLYLAGRLDGSIGGPTLDPDRPDPKHADQKRTDAALRRSLYFTHSRDDRDKLISMFDDADIVACYRRVESIVPQQALALSNGRLPRLMARELTTRLARELGKVDDDRFLEAAYAAILAVKPTAEEISACRDALADTKEALADSPTDSPGVLEPSELTARARENLVHALFNHNDFITIR